MKYRRIPKCWTKQDRNNIRPDTSCLYEFDFNIFLNVCQCFPCDTLVAYTIYGSLHFFQWHHREVSRR